jgi:Zn-dependent protease with chaperone function
MNRALLIAMVSVATYALLNIALSAMVAVTWRSRVRASGAEVSPARRAQQLVWLRALPASAALMLTALVATPAFSIFEPSGLREEPGPLLIALALAGLLQLAASCWIAAAAAARTYALSRRWLRGSVALHIDPPAGVPAFVITTAAPIVALIGVLRPRLVAARSVIDACTTEELTAIVAHERGHLRARDNLKRWLMACAPDALRWTKVHREITSAWHDAAEDAADDVATGAGAMARANLAALLVKIARLTPEPSWPAAAVSPFVEKDGLPRRVGRLLTPAGPPRPASRMLAIASAAAVIGAATALSSPALMKGVFEVIETLVALGR